MGNTESDKQNNENMGAKNAETGPEQIHRPHRSLLDPYEGHFEIDVVIVIIITLTYSVLTVTQALC